MSITEMDANGKVQLPAGIRCRLDLNEGDKLAIDQLGDGTIILKKLARRLSCKSAEWQIANGFKTK
jgi:AbrB family looped-hinge helix DNA binding protein